MKKGLVAALIAIIAAATFAVAFNIGYQAHQPVAVTETLTVYVDHPVFIDRTLIKPVEVPVVVTEVREVTPTPLGFRSLEKLQEWLATKEPTHRIYADGERYSCMDYCAQMIREAALEGHLFTQEGRMTGPDTAHALCKTSIDGEWVYVDPETYEVVAKDW